VGFDKDITKKLLTEAGIEGITLLEVENVHLLELSTTINKTKQAIGRAVRYKSHSNMPNNRKKVNIWTYNSTISKQKTLDKYMKKFRSFNTFDDYYNYFIKRHLDKTKDKVLSYRDILERPQKDKEFNDFYEILEKYSIENGNF
jgi:hypothetical protein